MNTATAGQFDHRAARRHVQTAPPLLRAVDGGLLAVLVLTPIVMGGRIAAGRLVFVAAAVFTAAAWCLYQYTRETTLWRRSGAYALFLAALGVGLLQVLPLPRGLLTLLAPNLAETLPLWFSAEGVELFGHWRTLSLTPEATWDALSLIGAFGLVFAVLIQRIESRQDFERIFRAMALLTAAIAAFALVQYFTTNGKYFWFYEHPYATTRGTIVGTFTNRNHFAQFIALGLGPLIWCLQTSLRRRTGRGSRGFTGSAGNGELETAFWGIALAVALFAGLMSLSRGGAMAMGAAVTASLLICYRGGLVGTRTTVGIASASVLLAAALSIWGYPLLAARLDDFGSLDDLNNGGRLQLWEGDSKGIAASWVLGHGLGSHRDVSPTYYANDATAAGIQYTHAESGYVQVPFETGLAGSALVLAGIGLCGWWCISPLFGRLESRDTLIMAAIAPGLAASAVHSISDFIWYVPGCMVPVTFLAAAACRFRQMTVEAAPAAQFTRPVPKAAWAAGAIVVALVGGTVLLSQYRQARAEVPWHEYIALCHRSKGADELSREEIAARAKLLYRVTALQPRHASAHARLAKLHLKSFNAPSDPEAVRMDERHIRETVLASQFATREEMRRWLSRAFESRVTHLDAAWYHVRAALSASPSLGGVYLLAGSLAFLETPQPPPTSMFLDQAVRVRPGDGDVLFAVGQEKMLAGKVDEAVEYYRRAAEAGRASRLQVFALLAPILPSETVIEITHPDAQSLADLRGVYGRAKRLDQLPAIDAKIAVAAEQTAAESRGVEAARHWFAAGVAHAHLKNKDEAVRCYRAAVRADATDFGARKALAVLLVERAEYEEAEKQLRWCLQRKPKDARLRSLLETAVEKSLRRPLQTAGREDERR